MEKVPMGPPPSRGPKFSDPSNSDPEPNNEDTLVSPAGSTSSTALKGKVSRADATGNEEGDASRQTATAEDSPAAQEENGCPSASEVSSGSSVPYSIPPWSEPPGHPFYFEVLKEGIIIEQLDASAKGAYMFGRVDMCDFILEHPTVSRYHAVLQFNKNGQAFLYDVGSTHGTFINKNMVKKKIYTEVHVGDVIRFGRSSRLYIFQGPTELMPPEHDLNKLRRLKMQEELQDREDSLARAKVEASLVDGISWGMAEDAVEESNENDAEEVTWQSFKGQLTERQDKTRSKIIKRMEKVANMRKEIDSIRAKDISQGGLTQGQQTQIARNEQRMSQIMEELDSLEETLNESIQESVGSKNKKTSCIRKKNEEENEYLSDDDEFYDRTKKKDFKKVNGKQLVETADSLLDKKDAITKEVEEKLALLQQETVESESHCVPSEGKVSGEEDILDMYMADLSSNIAHDKATKIQKEISSLQSELDRIVYLLKIADPSGEAAKKRENNSDMLKPHFVQAAPNVREHESTKKRKATTSHKVAMDSDSKIPASMCQSVVEEENGDHEKRRKITYSIVKPQWLGAKQDTLREDRDVEITQDPHDSEEFIDYRDRKKVLASGNAIEEASSGLIIRKEKHVQDSRFAGSGSDTETAASSSEIERITTDAMALLLKHKRGYLAADDEMEAEKQNQESCQPQTSQSKRVLGPEKPAFLDDCQDFQSWVPPEGQLGDGRTALNEKFGY